MNPIPDFIERCKALFFRDRLERELEEELRHHRALDEAAGIPPLQQTEQVKEAVRDARGVRPLEELIADTLLSGRTPRASRSEEHTAELQSRFDLACRPLPEKKKKTTTPT